MRGYLTMASNQILTQSNADFTGREVILPSSFDLTLAHKLILKCESLAETARGLDVGHEPPIAEHQTNVTRCG
jgi:hypothetical protein